MKHTVDEVSVVVNSGLDVVCGILCGLLIPQGVVASHSLLVSLLYGHCVLGG